MVINANREGLPEGTKPLRLSSQVLTHISAGLYRSAANALKELVSNAFDADARTVRINTNFPFFDFISCSDDGDGIGLEDFQAMMEGGIGSSGKRRTARTEEGKEVFTKSGRPVIGKLGIGMLAIAQICWEFEIISHHRKSKKAFKATLNLSPYRTIDAAEKRDGETNGQNNGSTKKTERTEDGQVEVGYYSLFEIPYDEKKAGVLISSSDLMPAYRSTYLQDVRREDFRPVPTGFDDFVSNVGNPATRLVRAHGPYWEMFWELGLSCPTTYLEDSPISAKAFEKEKKSDRSTDALETERIVKSQKSSLTGYGFNVFLDNIQLFKPIRLPSKSSEDRDVLITPVEYDSEVAGLPLKFSGYLFTQNGRAVYPEDQRGVLIRIKNIAVGGYDRTLLKFETIQGMRFDWVSGEINVEKGLEEALNIDRNSFNEVDPHYVVLRRAIHEVLKEKRLFYASQRRDPEAMQLDSDFKLQDSIRKVLRSGYTIRRNYLGSDTPIVIDKESKTIVIDERCPIWRGKGAKRHKVERILAASNLVWDEVDKGDWNSILIKLLYEIV